MKKYMIMIDSLSTTKRLISVYDKRLFVVKTIHTLIWVMFVAIIIFILWSGISGKISTHTWWATAAVIGEGLVLAMFKGRCPLTLIAKKYSNSNKENFDIFLPLWLAKYNKLIFGMLFVIGVMIMLYRIFLH